jgi:hypothetical protein
LGALGLFPPFFGVLPRSCDWQDPGEHGSHGGEQSAGEAGSNPAESGGDGGAGASAGEAGSNSAENGGDGGAGASAGEAGSNPAENGGDGGSAGEAGGSAEPGPDLVTEPLLGCTTGVSGKLTPGRFDVLPPYIGLPNTDYPWLTDWSGDGQTAVGVYTNEPFEGRYGAFFISWQSERGYTLEAKIALDQSQFTETPTSLASCDASVRVQLLGDGTVWANNGIALPATEHQQLFHDYLTLSEDGTSFTFFTGIRDMTKPWAEWHSTRGEVQSQILDPVQSLSWDGLTAFGTSSCYTQTCQYPKTFRWKLLVANEDVTTTAPTPYVAADGETIVFDYNATHIGVWRNETVETIDCVDACHALAWSSRAQVLLVEFDGDFALWTEPHGFRRLSTLLNIPADRAIVPTGLSLDGWTVTGWTSSAETPFTYFRATLRADAFQ